MDTYHTILLDHYHHPRNTTPLEQASFISKEYNPSCGDAITIEGLINGTILERLSFQARGCIINQAFASLLTETCTGKSLAYALSLTVDDVRTIIGIPLGPIRLKCALLCLQALQEGIKGYHNT